MSSAANFICKRTARENVGGKQACPFCISQLFLLNNQLQNLTAYNNKHFFHTHLLVSGDLADLVFVQMEFGSKMQVGSRLARCVPSSRDLGSLRDSLVIGKSRWARGQQAHSQYISTHGSYHAG